MRLLKRPPPKRSPKRLAFRCPTSWHFCSKVPSRPPTHTIPAVHPSKKCNEFTGRHNHHRHRFHRPGHCLAGQLRQVRWLADLRATKAEAAAKVQGDAGFEVSTVAVDVSSRGSVMPWLRCRLLRRCAKCRAHSPAWCAPRDANAARSAGVRKAVVLPWQSPTGHGPVENASDSRAATYEPRNGPLRWTTSSARGPKKRKGLDFSRPWRKRWWRRRGSNPRPSHCERDALPAELRPHEGREYSGAAPFRQTHCRARSGLR